VADRSLAQKIGARGHKWLAAQIESHSNWLARELGEDYGIDLEAELTESGVRGQILKIQIKSELNVKHNRNKVKFVIEKKYLDYARACRYPVIFCLVDVKNDQAWYVWLQDWLMRKQGLEGALKRTQHSWTAWISDQKTMAVVWPANCGL
jgi:Domain of unknown function (DUF4365)